ncbi:MAG: XRE family transcriptional regulator [Chloroflexota bacterium]
MELGARIREARLQHKLSVAALATASGLTKGFISQVESGKSQPSIASLGRIANALNIPVSALLLSAVASPVSGDTEGEPQLLVAANLYHEASVLTALSGEQSGSHYLATIPPGSLLLQKDAGARQIPHAALLIVLAGKVRIRQDQDTLAAAHGEVAHWDNSKPYAVTNAGQSDARVLIFLPSGSALPQMVSQRTATVRQLRRNDAPRPVGDGPMRLAAMRAERLTERGRR